MSEPYAEAVEPTDDIGPAGDQNPLTAPTGSDEVDAIVTALQTLGELPVDEHVAVYEQVHGQLRSVLARPPAE